MSMSCESYMAAISAELDGEDPGISAPLLERHVHSCDRCRAFTESAAEMRRRARVQLAPEMPDLADRVVRTTAERDRSSAVWLPRWLLGMVAVQIVVLALPELFASGDDAHSARHLGAFSLAYAVGLLVVVVRPARARTMLNVSVVLGAAILVTAVVDVAQGRVPLVSEALHIPELFSVLFLWLLARPRQLAEDASVPPGADLPDWVEELRSDLDQAHQAQVHPLRRRSEGR
jgi:predicted anti-sigma-YlaC factor YlaD